MAIQCFIKRTKHSNYFNKTNPTVVYCSEVYCNLRKLFFKLKLLS